MTLVLDVSNYDEETFDADCMKADHVDAIILGCQREDVADRMAAKAKAAGLPIMATYAFLYFGMDTLGQTMAAVRISKKYGIPRVFMDCESGQGTERDGITIEERQAELRDCIHAVTTEGLSAGIYTGGYWWPAKMGNTTEWAALPLWHAAYYNDHTKQKAVSYGGWSECAIHQWTSTLNVCGRNRDANEVWDLSLMEEDMTPAEVEAIVRKVFDEASSDYYRTLTRAYWDRNAPGAYSAEPDPEVVAAITAQCLTGHIDAHVAATAEAEHSHSQYVLKDALRQASEE